MKILQPQNNIYKTASVFIIFLCSLILGVFSSNSYGQLSSQEITIRKIDIKISGVANVSEAIVLANISSRSGIPYDELAIDRDIRSLYNTGLFEFIEVNRSFVGRDGINLLFDVRPKYRIGSIRFDGNRKLKNRKLKEEILSEENRTIDERQIKEDSEAILTLYRKKGYSQARVDYLIERNPSTGYGTIVFKIVEGGKVRIKDIKFVGNDSFKARTLRWQMEVKQWWFMSFLTGKGRFFDDEFEDDLELLRDYYREKGFLDVEILQSEITFVYPSREKMEITIKVNEGRLYHVGKITIKGSDVFPTDLLIERVLYVKSGDVFAPSKLDEDVTNLDDFYGEFGYLETRTALRRYPNLETGNIDIEYEIQESDRFYVESIVIEGNEKTKSTVILRELAMGPGRVFNTVRMETSKQRLENTQFFDYVDVEDESTNIPGRKNLKVTVREARTGNLSFGVGFSSQQEGTIFVEFQQGNFDLFNVRSMFQGDGQKFRIKLEYGSIFSQAILHFEEPWLFDKRIAAGFNLYRTAAEYTSTLYDEIRYGFEVYSRWRVIELITARVGYQYEVIDIINIIPGAELVPGIADIAGKTAVSRMGLTLSRDSRDNLMTPTRGFRVEGTLGQTGGFLGGEIDFYRLEAKAAKYFLVFKKRKQVLSISGYIGALQEFGDTGDVPYYDKFYLGGQNDLRGFDTNEVGPKGPFGTPLGGKSMAWGTIEYSFDLGGDVRFALFYDGGFVNKGSFDYNTSGYNDSYGIGLRLIIMNSPLRMDYAIPIKTDRFTDDSGQFNVSFGGRF
ncbi:MAG: outer membrane protein assembly factor BamA [Opitutaceae bacterium]|nr:outer membrane protein assembly factor BamA [Opitutaceae bacterium]